MTNKPDLKAVTIARRIQNVVRALRDEADNLSPLNDDGSGGEGHPAPVLRKWAKYLDGLSKDLASNWGADD